MSSNKPLEAPKFSDVQAAIVLKLRMIARPMTIDELMPICMPHTPHSVNQRTGCLVFDRLAFGAQVDDLVRRSVLRRVIDQVYGRIVFELLQV